MHPSKNKRQQKQNRIFLYKYRRTNQTSKTTCNQIKPTRSPQNGTQVPTINTKHYVPQSLAVEKYAH